MVVTICLLHGLVEIMSTRKFHIIMKYHLQSWVKTTTLYLFIMVINILKMPLNHILLTSLQTANSLVLMFIVMVIWLAALVQIPIPLQMTICLMNLSIIVIMQELLIQKVHQFLQIQIAPCSLVILLQPLKMSWLKGFMMMSIMYPVSHGPGIGLTVNQ